MSQDTSAHDTRTDEGRRPTGTEDLLPGYTDQGRTDQERTGEDAGMREEGRFDEDTSARAEPGYQEQGRLEGDRLDEDRFDQDRLDDQRTEQDRLAERVDSELGDRDQSQVQGTPATGQAPAASQATPATGEAPAAGDGRDTATPLFSGSQVEGFRSRWIELQAAFVDDPRTAVQQADQLVAEVMQNLAQMFNDNKQQLEGQWQREGTVDTENLRQALRRYRVFFHQLLRS
jgi:hypothetical protein